MKIPIFTDIQKVLTRAFYPSEKAITIFTEDKPSDKIFYSIILDRLLEDEIKINKIIPLGSKNVVVEKSLESLGSKHNSLFIVDGDIQVMEDTSIETNNLIPLNRYCIENYLCCPVAITKLLTIRTGKPEKEINTKLRFDKHIQKNGKLLLQLYYRYLLAVNLKCSIGFKKFGFFLNASQNKLDATKVRNEIKTYDLTIKQKLKQDGHKSFKQELDKRLSDIESLNPLSNETILRVLSGKDQLIPMIRMKMQTIDGSISSMNKDHLKRELADKFDLETLEFLKKKIKIIAS